MTDPQMLIVRKGVNEIIEACALAATEGGPDAVRKLKVQESDEVPPKPRKHDHRFDTVEEARGYAESEYTEYGV